MYPAPSPAKGAARADEAGNSLQGEGGDPAINRPSIAGTIPSIGWDHTAEPAGRAVTYVTGKACDHC